jgi:hypothetical protein
MDREDSVRIDKHGQPIRRSEAPEPRGGVYASQTYGLPIEEKYSESGAPDCPRCGTNYRQGCPVCGGPGCPWLI